jgi:hypothetical protein
MLMRFAGFAENGAWPVVGGTTDQAAVFLDACESIWAEQARWKSRRLNAGS